MGDCRHLRVSADAVAVDMAGRETPVLVHLCAFPLPDAFPQWMHRRCGASHVDPAADCTDCPAFAPEYALRPRP